MSYYEIQIKQLLADKADNFEVVYNPGEKEEFAAPVEFFACCDLLENPGLGEASEHDDFLGVILPVIFDEEGGGLEAVLTSGYKPPSEQQVRLRKRKQ